MKKQNHGLAYNANSNRFWNEALQKVLMHASDKVIDFGDGSDAGLETVRWRHASGDDKKPPDTSDQNDDILKQAAMDITVQFNQLASVHNISKICEAAGIIRDILSA
ncbi:MAG: hypothetical protein RBU23_04085 [Candidatus Auribacterota bacterium]|jgi:hypothetical protein|nr:hypothetical protein [Candidatus Auribacterota bacterium]